MIESPCELSESVGVSNFIVINLNTPDALVPSFQCQPVFNMKCL